MYVLAGVQLCNRPRAAAIRLSVALSVLVATTFWARLDAQEVASEAGQEAAAAGGEYTPAIEILSDAVAGLVRVPNLPKFCDAFEQTHLGQLMEEESMQPFIEAQRDRAKDYLQSIDNKIGLKLQDLYDIASGEVVFSWLPFKNDKRRPFAVCVVADIRGLKAEADKALATIDQDLKGGGWARKDVMHQGQTIRVYDTKPKPGQLKVEQIAITLSDVRIIAADRDSVVTDLLDAIAGNMKGKAISSREEFKKVLTHSGQAMREPIKEGGGTIAVEWFAKPFQMGRILRETFEVDRGDQFDIIKLLENQGFDAINAAGGVFAMAGERYDLLHNGMIYAPGKLEEAAKMLQFDNNPLEDIPTWVHENAASFNRMNLKIENAFWASETLINEAFGDEIFKDIIEGIRDDEDGPQIDIAKNVLPNLDDQIILFTDNTLPANVDAERMLVAIRVRDADAIKMAIRKAMEVEPDASKMDVLPGIEIWRVQKGEGEDDFDAELFGDLEFGLEDESDEPPPLLDHWAIALVEKGDGSDAPYLMFTSHPELLVMTAKRIQSGAEGGIAALPEVKAVVESLADLKCAAPAFDRVVRSRLSLRVKYELLREGKLKQSDSLLASLLRRMFEDEEEGEPDPVNAAKLPPIQAIEKHLPNGGSFFETIDEGWSMTGFLLK